MKGFMSEQRLAYGGWEAIERATARLYQHAGWQGIDIVGGSGDLGADVVGNRDGKSYVFQAKFRRSGTVSKTAVDDTIRALNFYKADSGITVTNQRFSTDAVDHCKLMQLNGMDIILQNGTQLMNYFERCQEWSRAYRTPRSYQSDAIDQIEDARGYGARSALAIMATGLGKSIVAYEVIAKELERNPNQEVLVLAHKLDLVRQLEISSWPQLGKSHSTHLWAGGEKPSYREGVVFATYQSLVESDDIENRFGLVVVDEAHNAKATEYNYLLERLNPNFLLGLTATPWRGDNKSIYDIFGEPVFTMDIIEGMQRGYLAKVDYRMITDPDTPWNKIQQLSKQNLSLNDLNRALILPERDEAMVDIIYNHFQSTESPKAIAFCRSIAHANRLLPLLLSRNIKAAVLHNGLSRTEKFNNLSRFRSGEIDLLLTIEMLNEGIDVPDANIVIFMRVTNSRRLFIQQLGRGLRITNDKAHVLVLDFVGDIKRMIYGYSMNQEAKKRGNAPEVVNFNDGQIVQFDNDAPLKFFDEYLADVAEIDEKNASPLLKEFTIFPSDDTDDIMEGF